MASSVKKHRIEQLARVLEESGIDCFVAQDPISMGYLHGFHEHGGERFMALCINSSAEIRMICPALSLSQVKRAGIEDARPWKDGEDPLAQFEQLSDEWNLKSAILAVDSNMPARMLLQMQSVLPAALFKSGETYLAQLMRVKSDAEVELLRRAGRIADDAFDAVHPLIRAGMTERQVDKMLVDAMAERGGGPGFCIVATGANSAEPHHLSDDTVLKDGDVLILDFGCNVEGYQSDITRTVAVGHASDKAKQVYDIVFRSHMAGRAQSKPGVTCGSVDAAARNVIEDAGYGEFFPHRTGHGLGMNGHEEPFIIGGSEVVLVPGNCFSIEPGIYLAGELGVRVENIVVATETGHESMNREPSPTLLVVG
ncbi:MAG: Xaa-Pro peptidase family protein [Fimbriimonas sp.]|nr:Xaa-Pro peptidase family protein [Fimbriimonas sp.]